MVEENDFTKSWDLKVTQTENDIEIANLLKNRQLEYENLDISKKKLWLVSQLLTENSETMYTWKQVKLLHSCNLRGKKTKWFAELENELIADMVTREVKPMYKLAKMNPSTPKIVTRKVKEDKRTKEWVMWKDKENSSVNIGKIREKVGKFAEVENYKEKTNPYTETGLKTLVHNSSQETLSIKRKELRDISNLVQKTENGPQLIFNIDNLESVLEDRTKSLLIAPKELQKVKENLVLVDCVAWEVRLIQKVVENQLVRNRLIEILEQNRRLEKFIFYTDGSLGTSEIDGKMNMGCGVVQITEEGQIMQQLAYATEKWFSSTRAELVAILIAILVTPGEKEVEIRTDSKAAILAIKKGLATDKARKWLKIKNNGLIASIAEIVKTKQLLLHLTKVKGHSGDFYNDLADLRAKEGATLTERLNPITLSTKEYRVKFKWENEVIEKPIRSFTKLVGKVLNRVEWSDMHNVHNVTHQERKSLQCWPVFYELLKEGTKQQNHTFKSNTAQLFELKCINNILPVLEKLNQRKPEIYKTSKCILCKKKTENVEHLVSCDLSIELVRNIEEQVVEATLNQTKVVEDYDKKKELILTMIGKGSLAEELRRRERWIRGLITKEDFEELRPIFISNRQTKIFIAMLWKSWMKRVYKEIWVVRCKLLQEWERSNGITQKKKRRQSPVMKGKEGKKLRSKKKNPQVTVQERTSKKKELEKKWKTILSKAKIEVLEWIRFGQRPEWWKN